MKKLKVAADLPYDKKCKSNLYCHAFVYPRRGEPCVYKGGVEDLEGLIQKNHPNSVVHLVFFNHGQTRNFMDINLARSDLSCYCSASWVTPEGVRADLRPHKKKRWVLTVYRKTRHMDHSVKLLQRIFRRPPRRWIRELDRFLVDPYPDTLVPEDFKQGAES